MSSVFLGGGDDECTYSSSPYCNHLRKNGYGDSSEIYKFKNETWILVGQTLYGRMLHAVSVIDYDDIQTTCDNPGSANYIN